MQTKRLSACAALVTKGGVVCDVGTDHAYLPAELLKNKICTRAVLTDIHAGPLEAARRTLREAGVLEQADLYQCDGLEQVSPGDITDIVIAGMGGENIIHILENCPWASEKHFILQPMTKAAALRQWLAENGYAWTEEIVTEQMRFYFVLDVCFCGAVWKLTELEREVGRLDWQLQSAQYYGAWKMQQFRKLAEKLTQANRPSATYWTALANELAQILENTIGGTALC